VSNTLLPPNACTRTGLSSSSTTPVELVAAMPRPFVTLWSFEVANGSSLK